MKTTLCTWEDEPGNRRIQFSVEYVIENGAVTIKTVTPTKVCFVCPDSNTVQHSIGVHTDAGRQMLAEQFKQAMGYEKLASAIANPNGDVALPNMSIRMEIAAV